MSEARTPKVEKTPAAPVRQRQTITLNEATNESVPRKGIKRRTDIGDEIPQIPQIPQIPPIPPLLKGGHTDMTKE